ncbi:HAMP domain-containing histidine kinase [Vibrio sp. D404a]|nr:HAMP domain-containing histidine kinase [Vibrio sp. D404a]MDK9798661.1 HAMP domain-containing histidine kinase [Vibrio sp. D449a]
MKSMSLNKRVVVSILVGFILGILTVSLYAVHSVKQVRRVAAYAQATALVTGYDRTQDINQLPIIFNDEPISYTLFDRDGNVLQVSDDREKPLKLKPNIVYSGGWLPTLETRGDRMGVPVTLDNGDILMVEQVDTKNGQLIFQVVEESIKVMLIALVHLGLLFSLIVYWAVRWTLSPVKAAAQAADTISTSNPTLISRNKQPKEILPLIDAVNGAIGRLTEAYQAQQRFIADAAHELRTPLTVLSLRLNQLNSTGCKELGQAESELQQIQHLTEQLLELARLEGVMENSKTPQESIDVNRLLRECIVDSYPLFDNANREVELEASPHQIQLSGYSHLLKSGFRNLLENAFYHGEGIVTVTSQSYKDYFEVIISDEGESPSAELRQHLFERFKKANVSSGGSGLGLSIVKQIVHFHGGHITFMDTPTTKIKMQFPSNTIK